MESQATPEQQREMLKSSFARIEDFIQSKSFQAVLTELYRHPADQRVKFVNEIIFDDAALVKRGVHVPNGLVIQRSGFKDKRPTLFCVTEALPQECAWEKTTFTFDNERSEAA